ncbi:MAG: type III secretion system export apparatus subunit SctT [Gammaproteobacteria bacterium]
MEFEYIQNLLLTILINSPRIASAFIMIPFFSRQMLPGALVKNGVVIALSMFLVPMNYDVAEVLNLYSYNTLALMLKEIFIGVVIGFIVTIPFWAVESVGFFIDNQRGSTMASTLNPLTGSQTSPLGVLFNQAMTTAFFVSGTFLVFTEGLYRSFKIWPLLSYYPSIDLSVMDFFINQISFMLFITVLLSSPIIISMFMSEFCFALINRFTPQLNVFVLSMPVKSAVAMFLLVLYVYPMFGYLNDELGSIDVVFMKVKTVLSVDP